MIDMAIPADANIRNKEDEEVLGPGEELKQMLKLKGSSGNARGM